MMHDGCNSRRAWEFARCGGEQVELEVDRVGMTRDTARVTLIPLMLCILHLVQKCKLMGHL